MRWICNSVRTQTDSVYICALLTEEFHNLNVAIDRSHMQGSSVIFVYSGDMNEVYRKLGPSTYQQR
jgi:hypothetical protein